MWWSATPRARMGAGAAALAGIAVAPGIEGGPGGHGGAAASSSGCERRGGARMRRMSPEGPMRWLRRHSPFAPRRRLRSSGPQGVYTTPQGPLDALSACRRPTAAADPRLRLHPRDQPRRADQAIHPPASNRRANANPVGPASYVTPTGPGSPATNARTSLPRPESRRRRSSPESRSMIAATVALNATDVSACAGRHPHGCGPRRRHSSTVNPRASCAGADPHDTTGQATCRSGRLAIRPRAGW
jgi:hypothetical protein